VLGEHSLVLRHQSATGEQRVTMLEVVREYARELLASAGELDTTARAHLGYYADLAARARRETGGDTQASWLQRLRREHANVRAALEWAAQDGPVETGLRLAGTLGPFWDYTGHRPEGLSWLERLLADAEQANPVVRAQALQTAGALAWWLGSHELSIARQLESLAIFRDLGEVRGAAGALRGIGLAVARQRNYGEAIPLLEEAVSLVRGLDDPALLASALMDLGVAVVQHGDPRRATALWEEALAVHLALHNELGMAICLINLGERSRAAGDLAQAQAQLEEGMDIARRLDSPYHLAAALASLGELARTRGDLAAAGARYRESLLVLARLGERSGVAVCLRWLAWVAWTEGRTVQAARFHGAADALAPGDAREDDEQLVHESTRMALREQLGDDLFAATYEAGARLSLDQVVVEASATT
jgi:non-specific serine/threonine protein kinase